MTLETLEFESAPHPQASVIVLHGLGADGHDFVPVAKMLDPGMAVRYIFPHAPMMPVTINNGYVMRAWYDIRNADLAQREDEGGLRESMEKIDALITREIDRGIPSEKIVLMGFSQGCAMTLMTGVRQPRKLAALVGMSGYLPIAGTTAAERHPANQDTPIFLGHGSDDPVQWHEYPIPHSVSPEEIADIDAFLRQALQG